MALGVWLTNFLHTLEKLSETQRETTSCTNYEKGEEKDETCQNFYQTKMMSVQKISWIIFLVLTFLHVWANYVGVQRLRLRTLNRERASVALREVVEECGRWTLSHKKNNKADPPAGQQSQMDDLVRKCSEKLPSPENVSESLWKSIFGMFYEGNIHLGIRVKDLVRMSSTKSNKLNMSNKWDQEWWDILRDEFHNERYLIVVDSTISGSGKRNIQPNISVMMRLGATNLDELKAFLHAHIVMWCIGQEFPKITNETSWNQIYMNTVHR